MRESKIKNYFRLLLFFFPALLIFVFFACVFFNKQNVISKKNFFFLPIQHYYRPPGNTHLANPLNFAKTAKNPAKAKQNATIQSM